MLKLEEKLHTAMILSSKGSNIFIFSLINIFCFKVKIVKKLKIYKLTQIGLGKSAKLSLILFYKNLSKTVQCN